MAELHYFRFELDRRRKGVEAELLGGIAALLRERRFDAVQLTVYIR